MTAVLVEQPLVIVEQPLTGELTQFFLLSSLPQEWNRVSETTGKNYTIVLKSHSYHWGSVITYAPKEVCN